MANNVVVWLYASDGTTYVDVTSYVTAFSCSRGKSRALDYYEPGTCNIMFNNYSRVFDPTNTSSPLYGYVKPKQRVYATINGNSIFSGWIDDWSFTYDVSGEASASLVASELSTLFANQFFLKDKTFPAELSGARISRVLNLDEVAWPGGSTIDAGTQMLDKALVVLGTNVLDYLRQVEVSEQGQLYVEGQDNLYFDDNSVGASTVGGFPTFADDGSGYYYEALDVSYTTQLLYNNIQVNAWDGIANRVATTPTSSALFSPISLSVDGVLYTNGDKLHNLASYISSKYSQPEYRFNSITVNMFALDLSQQSVLRSRTPLNGFAQVIFTPNGVGSAITRYVRIIGITHDVTAGSHLVTFNLESLKTPNLVIDDNEFGKLDNYALGL